MGEYGSNITIDEIAIKEDITIRTINICNYNELTTLNLILAFYKKFKTFKVLRNCGEKSENELVALCNKYISIKIIETTNVIENEKSIITQIEELSPFQKATLNRHLEYLISNLSIRAQNGLSIISNTLYPKVILEKIFAKNFRFKNIPNIGDKSVVELEKLENEICSFIKILQIIKEENLSKEYAKLIIETKFTVLPENFEKNFKLAFDINSKIKIFRVIEFLSNSRQLLNEYEIKAFLLLYSNTQIDSIETASLHLKITKERLRQIKTKLEENIRDYFLFISNFNFDDLVNYGIDETKPIHIIDKSLINKVNQSENVDFNQIFYSIIFTIIFKNKYKILGDDEVMSGIKRTIKVRKYLNPYLIKTEIYNTFNFQSFIEDVYKKISDRVEDTYSLNFEGYLYSFKTENLAVNLYEIKSICEIILFNEFDIVINSEGYLVIERNTYKQLFEYSYDILTEFSRPMTIVEIEKVFDEKYPEIKKTTDGIRGSLMREKELFVCFGRTSTYALKKWEQEKENLKGGTIRDMVDEYLSQFEKPIHISEIMDFLLKYRDETNAKSVITSLKIDNKKRFIVYSGNYVGLYSINYPPEALNFKKVIGSHFKPYIFEKMNGWDVEIIVNSMSQKHGYNEEQIRYFIQQKVSDGTFKISPDNKLIL